MPDQEDDATNILQGRGMCGFVSDDCRFVDDNVIGPIVRVACILPRNHDAGIHEQPIEISRLTAKRVLGSLNAFIDGDLSELSEGRPLSPREKEAFERAISVRNDLHIALNNK